MNSSSKGQPNPIIRQYFCSFCAGWWATSTSRFQFGIRTTPTCIGNREKKARRIRPPTERRRRGGHAIRDGSDRVLGGFLSNRCNWNPRKGSKMSFLFGKRKTPAGKIPPIQSGNTRVGFRSYPPSACSWLR
jgi:hypothetical protein